MNVEELFAAIEAGDAEAIKQALRATPELAEARNAEGISAIVFSHYRGKHDVSDVLLRARPNLDVFDMAAAGENGALKKLLKQNGDLVRERTPDGFTALHLAAFFARKKAVDILLDFGSDPRSVADNPMLVQPIHSAAAVQQEAIVKRLINDGADVNAAQVGGWTPLHAAAHSGAVDMARLLVRSGADPAQPAEDGRTALDLAREAEQPEIVQLLTA